MSTHGVRDSPTKNGLRNLLRGRGSIRRESRPRVWRRVERGRCGRPDSTAAQLPQEFFGPQVGNRSRGGLCVCDPVIRFVTRERLRCLVRERTIRRIDELRVAVLDRRFEHWRVLKQYCVQKSLTGREEAGVAEVASYAP